MQLSQSLFDGRYLLQVACLCTRDAAVLFDIVLEMPNLGAQSFVSSHVQPLMFTHVNRWSRPPFLIVERFWAWPN
ncbi:MAG TPA: hypothetical protein VFL51_17205 [Pseudolabrys sp.]|nr:hypothetical protein [Pseudolabrys sp.]